MSAKAARRTRQQGATANGQQHVNQPSREALRRENERLRGENEELRRKVAERERQIAEREKQIADRKRQIVELERKPGGQPGHPGHHRPLVPLAEVSAIEVRLPEQRGHCGEGLPQDPSQVTQQGEPRRHQVTEVPPVKAFITEYQFPNVVCGGCGKATQVPLPREIAGQFALRLTALIGYWTASLPAAATAGGSHAGRRAWH